MKTAETPTCNSSGPALSGTTAGISGHRVAVIHKKHAPVYFLFLICLIMAPPAIAKGDFGPVDTIRMALPDPASPALDPIAQIFVRQVQSRCHAKIVMSGEASLVIKLEVKPGIGKDGFTIADGEGAEIRIIGNDERGVLYGLGKLLRTSRYDSSGFIPGRWRGSSVPDKPVRGIYLASHFYNYYQNAPIDEIERYVEELALWGYNSVMVWYDMHHFNGFHDPKALELRTRLKDIGKAAKRIGLEFGLVVVANEAYNDSPKELRASGEGRGGWYPCAICPSKPKGAEYILKVLGEEFQFFSELSPDFLCIWPYDQGGCTCSGCSPWGSKGFITISEKISAVARQCLPKVKVILSTWFFDEQEMNELGTMDTLPEWVDLFMEGERKVKTVKHIPVIHFPEISMDATFPWGGFGATPMVKRKIGAYQSGRNDLSGGFPYSEGIFEDITKAAFAQFYWNKDLTIPEFQSEYISYEYSPDVVETMLTVLNTLERNHHNRWWPGLLKDVQLPLNWFPSEGARPESDPGAEEAYADVKKVDAILPERARKSWRWRIVFIRAMLDAELKANGGKPTQACIDGFLELMSLYHVSIQTEPCLSPPVPYWIYEALRTGKESTK